MALPRHRVRNNLENCSILISEGRNVDEDRRYFSLYIDMQMSLGEKDHL